MRHPLVDILNIFILGHLNTYDIINVPHRLDVLDILLELYLSSKHGLNDHLIVDRVIYDYFFQGPRLFPMAEAEGYLGHLDALIRSKCGNQSNINGGFLWAQD